MLLAARRVMQMQDSLRRPRLQTLLKRAGLPGLIARHAFLQAFHREVTQVCKAQKLRVPARNTVALRIASLDPRKVIRRREGQDAARDLQGVGGEPPAVTAPLEQVQIDHTVIDQLPLRSMMP